VVDGQSFAIGGLIKNNVTGTINALPGAGEVPVLGALFRSTNFQQDRTELVFVVTPRLVKPLPANYTLPTDRFGDVSEAGVLLTGNMEGTKAPHTAPAAAGAPQSALPATGSATGSNAAVVTPAAPAAPATPAAVATPVALDAPVAAALPDTTPTHGVMLPVATAKAP
jgi:pilus assembly protein CpaC